MDIRDSYDRANQNEATVEESDRPAPSRSQSGTASRRDSDPAAAPQDTPTPSWCRCGNCQQMPTQIENKCCRLRHCFTTEQQFHDAVLNTVVLATCMNREKDLFPHDIPRGNQSYRHYAYRRYTYLVHPSFLTENEYLWALKIGANVVPTKETMGRGASRTDREQSPREEPKIVGTGGKKHVLKHVKSKLLTM